MDNEDKKEEYEVTAIEEAEVVEAEPVEAEVLGPAPVGEEKKGFFSQFPRLYWVVDALEFFERGAFYGALAVMGPYVVLVLGFPDTVWGALYSLLYILLYFIPIISAALAEKYGYKTVLVSCLILLALGYLLVLFVTEGNIILLTISILAIGFGAGAFKPLVSATIAHITTDKKRNFAYSIYYWFINLGAFLMNVAFGALFLLYGLAEEWYFIMFIVAVVLISINVFISFSMFKNPVEPERDLSITDALKKIVPALKDKKFMILIFIYSGFWFIYAFNHTFLALYMLDFQRMAGWFNVFLLAMINPGTIILVGPYLGKVVEKYKSLKVMMIGIAISLVGFLLVLFSVDPFSFITGIIVFSIGEFITHPGFIAYVSKIAPKDKVAIYMGILFFPTLIGTVVGGIVHSLMYEIFIINWHRPKLFGAGLAATGLLTITGLILYNRWINQMAKEEDPNYVEDKSIWVKRSTSMVTLLLIPVVIAAGVLGGTDVFYRGAEEEGTEFFDWADNYDLVDAETLTFNGDASENSQDDVTVDIGEENVKSISFKLTWTDEPASTGFENDPDTFSLSVETPNGTVFESEESTSSSGSIPISISFNPDKPIFEEGTGTYQVAVKCGTCGDQHGPLGFYTQPDTGNEWDLTVDYDYYIEKEE